MFMYLLTTLFPVGAFSSGGSLMRNSCAKNKTFYLSSSGSTALIVFIFTISCSVSLSEDFS